MVDLSDVPVWIAASIRKTMIDRCQGKETLFFEGDDRRTNKEKDFLEVRIDGPYITYCGTQNELHIYVEVNILANCTRNDQKLNRSQQLIGLATQMLNTDICVYKIGDASYNGLFYCTLKLMPSDHIKSSFFGQIDPNVQVFQSTTEAHFEAYTE